MPPAPEADAGGGRIGPAADGRRGAEAERILHPILRSAASGELPAWTTAGEERRRHAGRVAALLGRWAEALGLSGIDAARWRAAGQLHDAMKGATEEALERLAGADVPPPLRHGLACAERLRSEGVDDGPLLQAIAYHTSGHPEFGELGESLYLADFLEPGRPDPDSTRARLRERLPCERRPVLTEVVEWRLRHLLEIRTALLPQSVEFWNRLVDGVGGTRAFAGDGGDRGSSGPR